jgi:hypothetical protein
MRVAKRITCMARDLASSKFPSLFVAFSLSLFLSHTHTLSLLWLDVPCNLCSDREFGAAKVSTPVFSITLSLPLSQASRVFLFRHWILLSNIIE